MDIKEMKQALKRCIAGECNGCPYVYKVPCDSAFMFDLIESLTALEAREKVALPMNVRCGECKYGRLAGSGYIVCGQNQAVREFDFCDCTMGVKWSAAD